MALLGTAAAAPVGVAVLGLLVLIAVQWQLIVLGRAAALYVLVTFLIARPRFPALDRVLAVVLMNRSAIRWLARKALVPTGGK